MTESKTSCTIPKDVKVTKLPETKGVQLQDPKGLVFYMAENGPHGVLTSASVSQEVGEHIGVTDDTKTPLLGVIMGNTASSANADAIKAHAESLKTLGVTCSGPHADRPLAEDLLHAKRGPAKQR